MHLWVIVFTSAMSEVRDNIFGHIMHIHVAIL